MKKIAALLLALVMALTLCACGHEHSWVEATCTEPKTCSECGETEGEALGHSWTEATCTEPKTCSRCGLTEGEALGHSWKEATCTEPRTCSGCGLTEGDALGHTWEEASFTAPKTCSTCGQTDGEPLTPAYFPMNSYEYVDAFNRANYAVGTLSKDSNTMDIPQLNTSITLHLIDISDPPEEVASIIPNIDFNELTIKMIVNGSSHRHPREMSMILVIGEPFAQILDPEFDYSTFIYESSESLEDDYFIDYYSHNGYEYTLEGKPSGSGDFCYEFTISLTENKVD